MVFMPATPPDRNPPPSGGEAPAIASTGEAETDDIGAELLVIARQAETTHQSQASTRNAAWQRSYRAYRNQHFSDSKYLTPQYRSRSKLFVPKTRSGVRAKQTTAAAALFSTDEVVSIKAEHDDDDRQRASAEFIHEDLNYRLDRTTRRGGMPWFPIAMGVHQDAQITGVCCSKQDWEYEEKRTGEKPVMVPMVHPETGQPSDPLTGKPYADPMTGEPIMVEGEEMEPIMKVVRDRPMIMPIPPENVIFDPATPYYEVAQGSEYFIVRFPMALGAVKRMIKNPENNPKARVKWRQVDEASLKQAAAAYDAKGVRMAREGRGQDRMDLTTVGDYTVVWLHENFIRRDGEDWHFWSVGTNLQLSDLAQTEEVYPAFDGERPYTYGYGAIEAHNPFPMAPVEAWQQLQQEINDTRNLRLDASKQAVLPFAKVRPGKQIDVAALTKIGPGSHIFEPSEGDITFQTIPSGAGQLFPETAHLNTDFDELAAQFSGSAVQNNRTLNETVGGMQLLSGSANGGNEFDLRVWTETWTEPTIRQVVHLIQFYENDQRIMAIAKNRAQLVDKYGIDEVTDEMLRTEVTVKVNIGLGASDPMQKVAKLGGAIDMLFKILPAAEPKVTPNSEALITEVMGASGFKDGKRFFNFPDPEKPVEEPPDPEIELRKAEIDAGIEKANIDAKSDIEVATLREQGAMAREEMKQDTAMRQVALSAREQAKESRQGRLHDLFRGAIDRSRQDRKAA